jgi:hypothetical protein
VCVCVFLFSVFELFVVVPFFSLLCLFSTVAADFCPLKMCDRLVLKSRPAESSAGRHYFIEKWRLTVGDFMFEKVPFNTAISSYVRIKINLIILYG